MATMSSAGDLVEPAVSVDAQTSLKDETTATLSAVDDKRPHSSMPEKLKVGPRAQDELSASTMSPFYDDHDYVCCRTSNEVAADKDHARRTDSGESKTTSRHVDSFLKVGHDSRRKLCVVGFNWNSSQLRLNKLGRQSGMAPSQIGDTRTKPRDKSSRSKVVLTSCSESTNVAETAMHNVCCSAAGSRSGVVKGVGSSHAESGSKRRSKVYIYKPATSTPASDFPGARSTTAKPVPLVNKSSRGKHATGNTLMSAVEEVSAAVESIMPSDDYDTMSNVSVQRAGEYTIHLSAKGPSKPSVKASKKASPDYGYLSSLFRESDSRASAGCEVVSAAAVSLQQIIESDTQTSAALSTAPLGIPSPFLLQTGLEQALGFAAFHPMSPSTSSSSCSRVAGDDWGVNDDDDEHGCSQTLRPDSDGAQRCTVVPPESWIGSHLQQTCGSDDASALGLSASQAEPVYFDDFSSQFTNDGDLRYASSSFVVSEDNWDGYQREEQVDDCWSQHSPKYTSGFGRKSAAASRFRFTDSRVIASLRGGGSGFGRAGGRADRRRKQSEDRLNRKLVNGGECDVIAAPGSNGSETVSTLKKSCRQRSCGDSSKRSGNTQSESTLDGDHLETVQKTSSQRRRKQPTAASRRKYAAAVDNLSSEATEGTVKVEGAAKRRTQARSSRGQHDGNVKPQTSAVQLDDATVSNVMEQVLTRWERYLTESPDAAHAHEIANATHFRYNEDAMAMISDRSLEVWRIIDDMQPAFCRLGIDACLH